MRRAARVRRELSRRSVGSLLISDPLNVHYLCGYPGTPSVLLLLKRSAHLFVARLNYEQAVKQSHSCRVRACDDPIAEAARFVARRRVPGVAYETTLALSSYRRWRRLTRRIPQKAADGLVERIRTEKDEEEISFIRRSAQITSRVMNETIPLIKPGVRELDLAAEIEYRFRKNGSAGCAFPPIVASGPNSSLPHAVPGTRRIRRGDFVTIDLGGSYRGYASDMTRTFVVGRASEKQRRVYEAVQKAQEKARRAVSPGKSCREIDSAARDLLVHAGLGERFIHSLGHGVGLAVHEGPQLSQKSRSKLTVGMVVTIEPGVYIPRWGGVRIEDTVLVRRDGADVLTRGARKLVEI